MRARGSDRKHYYATYGNMFRRLLGGENLVADASSKLRTMSCHIPSYLGTGKERRAVLSDGAQGIGEG